MAFYNEGERHLRPGVYLRIVNRGTNAAEETARLPDVPESPDLTDEMIVSYNSDVVTLTLPPGCTMDYDGNGTVTLTGLKSVAYDNSGIVTIGG